MVNFIGVSGNLGQDAELRHTNNGKAVLNFSIANTTGFGEHEKTSWFRCALFGDRAEKLHQYFIKGTRLMVTGEITESKWKDNNGNERSSSEIFVKDFDFMDKKRGNNGQPRRQDDDNSLNDGFDDSPPF